MESNNKLSFNYLTEKLGCNFRDCRLCLFELPKKKTYRVRNMVSNLCADYYCKGIFIGYDGSKGCFLALLEDVYSEKNTGKLNIATSYLVSLDRLNSIFQQFTSGGEEIPVIPIKNFKEKDFVAYNGETYL